MMKFKNIFLFGLIIFFSFTSCADFSYEDLTYSHTLHCCNSTHCVDLIHINNTFSYTDMYIETCFELGGVSKLSFIDMLLNNFPILLFILILFMFIIYLIRRGRKTIREK